MEIRLGKSAKFDGAGVYAQRDTNNSVLYFRLLVTPQYCACTLKDIVEMEKSALATLKPYVPRILSILDCSFPPTTASAD